MIKTLASLLNYFMVSSSRRKVVCFLGVCFESIVGGWGAAFLAYSYSIEKVDCVIVMVGDGSGGRFKGAEQLLEQGRSEVLLIPAYNKVAFAEETGLGEMGYVKMAPVCDKPVKFMGWRYRVFENTHLDMLKGKKIMDKLGYRWFV